MTDLLDFLGLPPPTPVRARARTRCADPTCHRPVYADQLIHGYGRCCAERRGLIVRRHRLRVDHPAGVPTLFDRQESHMEPFPHVRIDVTRLSATQAHTRIVEHAQAMIDVTAGGPAAHIPLEVVVAANDQWAGTVAILERHAPVIRRGAPMCDEDWNAGYVTASWPCADYRDACRGLVTGLEVPV